MNDHILLERFGLGEYEARKKSTSTKIKLCIKYKCNANLCKFMHEKKIIWFKEGDEGGNDAVNCTFWFGNGGYFSPVYPR